ncbi:GNAT family N-acetyltransferase/peptidase C39 family protein [Marinospirillum sp.]|uniref:GNAT family N-acetyltransferase/peptidase C39 family protein n=1 Tax=Marinospirillum sp. TaxID=2183934 RepID=UPI00286FF1AF|nr:GNAT family N-acetyltransferase/peptidase C39 family protein [Marinospirillum sp.]MDR9467536.1 GNAT family N-acetyltransferase/peptidase C39 family protein [Marinospirillum sp.]
MSSQVTQKPLQRAAQLTDLDSLLALEARCFASDRLSRRQFRWLLQKGHASLQVLVTPEGQLVAYLLLLFHRGTSLARIYSLAVAPEQHGQGLGKQLLASAETLALEQGCSALRLEVRPDNQAAIHLYTQAGYRQFGEYADYYEDHATALRFQKRLYKPPGGLVLQVPYYQQTLPFTCGPASLMMAMKAQDEGLELNRSLELQLWREATSIFMTTGHGGCGPRGLALAAWQRGFRVELWINREGPLFVRGVRDCTKKEVLTLVHQDFATQMEKTDIREHLGELTLEDLFSTLEAGGVPLVLISSWRFSRQKSPHWVVVTAMDDQFIYLNDPEVDEEEQKSRLDTLQVPVSRKDFLRMACFGQEKLRTAVAVFPKRR